MIIQEDKTAKGITLRDTLLKVRRQSFSSRVQAFSEFMSDLNKRHQNLYMRQILSPTDREVVVLDPFSKQRKKMLMFGSNNYLGLANHPYVHTKIKETLAEYGAGVAGPPLLNGYSVLYRKLEEKLADFKHTEDCLLFSSGYAANVGLLSALMNQDNQVLFDEYSHASFCDGLRMSKGNSIAFKHNNINDLESLLLRNNSNITDVFVGVEGVYSMDGDLAPLDKITAICNKRKSWLIVDDAHGTGVLGKSGSGTAEHFAVDGKVDITMGTFSKTFAMAGGFVAASREIIDYLRYFARSHMFSAALPPVVLSAVLAGIKVIEDEPYLRSDLQDNIAYMRKGLNQIGFNINPVTPIIALHAPKEMNIREAAYHFHNAGIFVNSIEYPAVPENQQRFRISLMATHTKEDLNRLLSVIEEVWSLYSTELELKAS
jgi:glycine C-acetyltransferase